MLLQHKIRFSRRILSFSSSIWDIHTPVNIIAPHYIWNVDEVCKLSHDIVKWRMWLVASIDKPVQTKNFSHSLFSSQLYEFNTWENVVVQSMHTSDSTYYAHLEPQLTISYRHTHHKGRQRRHHYEPRTKRTKKSVSKQQEDHACCSTVPAHRQTIV